MAKKKYNQKASTTEVTEPGLAYQIIPRGGVKKRQTKSMSVDEYFDKVKKALDNRYENL